MQSTTATARPKDRYKLRNWSSYNQSLCRRGAITLWIDDSLLTTWAAVDTSRKQVGLKTYPDPVIYCCLVLAFQYHLRLRQATGFVTSMLRLLGKTQLPVPDYSTLSRRQKSLPVPLTRRWEAGEKIDIAIDSTGLKVYGEGEWKVRKYGASKRRTWRKLHVGIDLNTQEIISVELTTNAEDDALVGARMMEGKAKQLRSFYGDGGYDKFVLREALGQDVIQLIVPPKNAVVHDQKAGGPVVGYLEQRNDAVWAIGALGSEVWKAWSGYHRRSLNEVAMMRYKTIFGGGLSARSDCNEEVEVKLKCAMLNRYRELGMPQSFKVA